MYAAHVSSETDFQMSPHAIHFGTRQQDSGRIGREMGPLQSRYSLYVSVPNEVGFWCVAASGIVTGSKSYLGQMLRWWRWVVWGDADTPAGDKIVKMENAVWG